MVPFFDYPSLYKRFEADFNRIFTDVCGRGAFILQKELALFENNLAEYLAIEHCIGVADGTNALVLGLMAHDIGAGDEVIISSHTYIATAAAIKMCGATPVFADIDQDFLLCASSAEKHITRKTKAIMPTQLNGMCCNMKQINEVASKHNLFVFEDSAQGLGARFEGKCAGTFGEFGTLSFYPAKVLGCFGDGGAVLTKSDVIARRIQLLRDHGRNDDGIVEDWGTNCRLDNLQAAFLDFRLKTYHEDVSRRRAIAARYVDGLKDLGDCLTLPRFNTDGTFFDVYQNFEFAAEDRSALRDYLKKRGIQTVIQWGGTPVHHFEKLGFGKGKFDLPNTDRFFDRCLMVPIHMALSDDKIDYVIDGIRSFYKA
jgi:dTDP-4-amino-4,6-dideoxygalactose transaminase